MSTWRRLSGVCWALAVCLGVASVVAGDVHLDADTDLVVDTDPWENAPRVDLVCRAYGPAVDVLWRIFMPTYLLFWPISAWTSSGVVLVLDGDEPVDHQMGTMVQNLDLYPRVQVKYEDPPPNGTTCSEWRREGYSRQQWSNFYADLYSDAEYIAIVDTDAAFIAPVLPDDLFEDGKPIAKGINAQTPWESEITEKSIGGHKSIGRFMSKISFPVVIKSSHFQDIRKDMTANLGASTFEEAFHIICSFGDDSSYSQFEIMMSYLWFHKRDEYSWHLLDPVSNAAAGRFLGCGSRRTDDTTVLAMNIPMVFVMYHLGKAGNSLSGGTYKNLCIGTNFTAGDCGTNPDVAPSADDGKYQTLEWSIDDTTWQETHEQHVRKVLRAETAYDWWREDSADSIKIGP